MNWKEFYNSLIFSNRSILIPDLGITIDKTKFVTNKGYNVEKQDSFLKELYNSSLLTKK